MAQTKNPVTKTYADCAPSTKEGHRQGDPEAVQVEGFHGAEGNLKVAQLLVTPTQLRCQQNHQPAFSE